MKSSIQMSVGIFISISTGVALFINGEDTIPSLTVGLLGSILSLLSAIKFDVLSGEEKIIRSIKLAKELNKNKVLKETVYPIILGFDKIDPKNKILLDIAIDSLKTSQNVIAHVSEGKILANSEESRAKILIKLFNSSKDNIRAASYPNRWIGKINESVFQSNISAISRGVRIQRVHICREFNNEEFLIIKNQMKYGVESYIVDEKDVLPKHRRHMIIFDEKSATLPDYDKEGNNNGGLISFDKKDVSRITRLWESLEIHATLMQTEDQLKKLFETVGQ